MVCRSLCSHTPHQLAAVCALWSASMSKTAAPGSTTAAVMPDALCSSVKNTPTWLCGACARTRTPVTLTTCNGAAAHMSGTGRAALRVSICHEMHWSASSLTTGNICACAPPCCRFSGHFHLSQNYLDSISVVGRCAFVQTGVIGECHRDGNRCVRGRDTEGVRSCSVSALAATGSTAAADQGTRMQPACCTMEFDFKVVEQMHSSPLCPLPPTHT